MDLYPTLSSLCGLKVPTRLQGRDFSTIFDDPTHQVRDAAFSVNGNGFLLREHDWAFIQYGETGNKGIELFDMKKDPKQYTNLAADPNYAEVVARFQKQMKAKLAQVRSNDLGLTY